MIRSRSTTMANSDSSHEHILRSCKEEKFFNKIIVNSYQYQTLYFTASMLILSKIDVQKKLFNKIIVNSYQYQTLYFP